jgi:hypothetical protein
MRQSAERRTVPYASRRDRRECDWETSCECPRKARNEQFLTLLSSPQVKIERIGSSSCPDQSACVSRSRLNRQELRAQIREVAVGAGHFEAIQRRPWPTIAPPRTVSGLSVRPFDDRASAAEFQVKPSFEIGTTPRKRPGASALLDAMRTLRPETTSSFRHIPNIASNGRTPIGRPFGWRCI